MARGWRAKMHLTFHWLNSSLSDRIVVTIAEPCLGGLLYMGLITCSQQGTCKPNAG